jgi:hypothetical protein
MGAEAADADALAIAVYRAAWEAMQARIRLRSRELPSSSHRRQEESDADPPTERRP